MKIEANISKIKGYYFLSRCLSLRLVPDHAHILPINTQIFTTKSLDFVFYQIVALHGKRKGSLKHMYKNIYGKQKN